VDYFGKSDRYTILVFDNRGVGNSGTPKGPYAYVYSLSDVYTLSRPSKEQVPWQKTSSFFSTMWDGRSLEGFTLWVCRWVE
jgi:pimeloyl-ACP methyl ester carboxylesterase